MKKFNIKFYENRKIYFGITITLLVVGVIFNIIFGTTLDVQFKGGAMLDYSFSGEIDTGEVESIVEEVTGQNVDVGVYSSMVDTNGASSSGLSITFAGTDSITVDEQNAITSFRSSWPLIPCYANTIGPGIIFGSDYAIGGADGVLSRGMQWQGMSFWMTLRYGPCKQVTSSWIPTMPGKLFFMEELAGPLCADTN